MKYRKLRIAFSAACGILCLLLIALWMRSYWWWDNFHGPIAGASYTVTNSLRGQLSFGLGEFVGADAWGWGTCEAADAAKQIWLQQALGYEPSFGFCISRPAIGSPSRLIFFFPHWFAVVAAAFLAVVAWLPWRYSLRTLLIAMTVVAVGLGLSFAVSR